MKISFSNKKKDMFGDPVYDVKIPIGPQLNKEVEFNPTGKTKVFVQILAYSLSAIVLFIIIWIFLKK